MTQALHLMKTPEVEAKLASDQGRVDHRFPRCKPGRDCSTSLCLAAPARTGAKQRQVARQLFATAPPAAAAQDFLWTLLNCYEFLFIQ